MQVLRNALAHLGFPFCVLPIQSFIWWKPQSLNELSLETQSLRWCPFPLFFLGVLPPLSPGGLPQSFLFKTKIAKAGWCWLVFGRATEALKAWQYGSRLPASGSAAPRKKESKGNPRAQKPVLQLLKQSLLRWRPPLHLHLLICQEIYLTGNISCIVETWMICQPRMFWY